MSLDFQSEHSIRQLAVDTRSPFKKFDAWIKNPNNIGMALVSLGVLSFILPSMPFMLPMFAELPLWFGLGIAYWSYSSQIRAGLVLCFPKSSGVKDPMERDKHGKMLTAEGIVYLGNDMETGEEVWLSDTMARTHMMFLGTTGAGKALSNRSLVLTPSGWKRMGDVEVGDILCIPGGKTTEVTGVFPQGRRRMWQLRLANGRVAECCEEHLWQIRSQGDTRVARTDELLDLLRRKIPFDVPVIDIVPGAEGFMSSESGWTLVKAIDRGEMQLSTCIAVKSAEHLFITADHNGDRSTGIVTHNTEFLLSVVYNSLIHGSGFIYVDGKADSSLYAKIYSMARVSGRDSDVRVINFQTGAKDIFGPQAYKMSNTVNPFAVGSSGMLNNLVVSLMSSGKGDVWENRAISFVEALMKPLVFLRDNYGLLLDVAMIRDFFDLKRLEDLAWRDEDKYPGLENSLDGMRSYLDNLPTYDRTKHHKQSETAYEQHGYITMQLVRTFNSLADTYGYIMKTPLAEIDFLDVFLNRRILVVLLPALEKSPAELQNLGKIIVASIKATMAVGLGSRIEGAWAKIIDSKPTTSPSPFACLLDEYGFYSVEGFSVVPAQARSLGFSAIFAGQDLPAFQKSSEKEADSTLANTNTKVCGKLTCTKTAKYFSEYSSSGYFTRKAGFEIDKDGLGGGYKSSENASIEKMERVTLDDLKKQKIGQWTLWYADKIARIKSFYAAPPKVKTVRVNRFLKVARPQPDVVSFYREANQRFIDAMAHPEGLSSEMNTQLDHDLLIVREGLEEHKNSNSVLTTLSALMHHHKDAVQRAAGFAKQLELIGQSQFPGIDASASMGVASSPDGGSAAAAFGAWADPNDEQPDPEVGRQKIYGRGPKGPVSSAPGNAAGDPAAFPTTACQHSTSTSTFDPAGPIGGMNPNDLFGDLNFNSDDEPTKEELTARLQTTNGTVSSKMLEADVGDWYADNKFTIQASSDNFYSPGEASIEDFKGANIFGLTEEKVEQPAASQTEESGGILNRDLTEAGLEKLEMALGASPVDASLHASITASKLQDVTKYPITPPADSVTTENFLDAARRLSEQLDIYNTETSEVE